MCIHTWAEMPSPSGILSYLLHREGKAALWDCGIEESQIAVIHTSTIFILSTIF